MHLVRPTRRLFCPPGRRDWRLTWPCSGRGLPCRRCYQRRGALLPHAFHPCLRAEARVGGLLSVALSVASPRPAVSWRPALWSSDFPRRTRKRTATVWRTPSVLYFRAGGTPATARIRFCHLSGRVRRPASENRVMDAALRKNGHVPRCAKKGHVRCWAKNRRTAMRRYDFVAHCRAALRCGATIAYLSLRSPIYPPTCSCRG